MGGAILTIYVGFACVKIWVLIFVFQHTCLLKKNSTIKIQSYGNLENQLSATGCNIGQQCVKITLQPISDPCSLLTQTIVPISPPLFLHIEYGKLGKCRQRTYCDELTHRF